MDCPRQSPAVLGGGRSGSLREPAHEQKNMKPINYNLMRRAQSVLATGLVLGGLLAATASASVYQMQSNYVAGSTAPYNTSGGVPPAAYQNPAVVVTSTNVTLKWYGVQGFYQIQATTNIANTNSWITIATVKSSDFAGTYTGPKPDPTNSYSFRLALVNNYYAGQNQCSSCHGDKYTEWSGTAHARAIKEHLNPDGSFIPGHSTSCLPCHTVGYNQPSGYAYDTNAGSANYSSPMANVGCENCHGPAGWHKNSDHDVIRPVLSVDPSICGSCHQGAVHPTFMEYTNTVKTLFPTNVPAGIVTTDVGHYIGGHNSFGCAFCHNAVNRDAMIGEYYDKQAGNPHPVAFTTAGVPSWTATCATCHDPHASNYVAQLRYPTYSTNYFVMPTVTDTRTVVVTNFNGSFTTNTVYVNSVVDALFNPKIQVCAQCHSGGRGMRWDGTAYSLTTNLVSATVTNLVYIYTTNSVSYTNIYGQVFSNAQGNPVTYQTYAVTTSTNPVIGVGIVTPLIAYTNGGTVYYTTNSSGFSVPHYPVQYNILIGQADFDYASNGVPNKTHAHTTAPDQCATCHVPKYATGAHSNNTGHSFAMDYYGCQSSCHSSYSSAALAAKVLNQKMTQSNSMDRVVSLLKQWSTNVAPAILRTNFGPLAWEFPSIGALSKKVTNNGVIYASGPPSAYKPSLGAVPSGTNDNLQLAYVPQDIRMARFSLYVVYEDQSLGVHNPSYVSALLADAETRVINQLITSNYPASFAANTLKGFAPLSVAFTNYGTASSYSWNFGDGQDYSGYTSANPTYTYNTPGLYSVTCTADGSPLTRTKYIWVQQRPTVAFTADNTTVTAGTTVNFSNTSSNTNDVYLWRWYPMFNTNSGVKYDTSGGAFSFTYTNAGTYDVRLRASCPAGTATNTAVGYITVH